MTAWLLTWLWQGSALALGVAVALRCAPRLNAATRFLIWCGALAALAWLGWESGAHPAVTVTAPAEPVFYIPSAPDGVISLVAAVWTSIALVNLLRLLPSLHTVYALRDRCRPLPPDIEGRLPLWLEAKQRGRRSDLMLCDELPGATVLGLQRPCIAMPSLLVEALTIDELDQVILHEHAHVQRRDDWSRLAQSLLLSALWIHPAALVVSRALNREREMACDEWVVARTGLPKAYALCLAHAADIRGRTRAGSGLVPALVGRRHELLRRVDRLLGLKGRARRNISLASATVAACAMVVVSTQLQGVRFAEIADIALPHVGRPALAVYDAPATIRRKPDTTGDGAPVARIGTRAPIASAFAPESAVASADTPIAPIAPVAPVLSARTYTGAYSWPDATAIAPGDQRGTWSALAAPGVEMASAAKKTGIGIANALSRAGVSLGRTF